MERVLSYALAKIEAELKAQKISKRKFAQMIGKQEPWLHNIFARRRELKAEDFLGMLYALRLSCDKVLPPSMAAEIRGLTFEEWIERIVGQKIEQILRVNGFDLHNGFPKPKGDIPGGG